MLIQDYLDICDPVLTFDRFMGEIELEKYLKNIPQHDTGRLRYTVSTISSNSSSSALCIYYGIYFDLFSLKQERTTF